MKTETVIIAYGPVSGSYEIDGEYVKSYDPNAFDGRGDATFTKDITKALKFPDKSWAMRFAMHQPINRPFRADGKPNRPLTAFTLEFVDVDP
jgi:hypothetical protein